MPTMIELAVKRPAQVAEVDIGGGDLEKKRQELQWVLDAVQIRRFRGDWPFVEGNKERELVVPNREPILLPPKTEVAVLRPNGGNRFILIFDPNVAEDAKKMRVLERKYPGIVKDDLLYELEIEGLYQILVFSWWREECWLADSLLDVVPRNRDFIWDGAFREEDPVPEKTMGELSSLVDMIRGSGKHHSPDVSPSELPRELQLAIDHYLKETA